MLFQSNALPTLGYGASGGYTSLAAYGYGGDDDSSIVSGSYYYSVGKTLVPIGAESSGPLMIVNQGNGMYSGFYYAEVHARDSAGKPIKDTQWHFFAENVSTVSGTTETLFYNVHTQTSTVATSAQGRARYKVGVGVASGLANLFNLAGTSGYYISIWAIGDVNYITPRLDIQYRVVH